MPQRGTLMLLCGIITTAVLLAWKQEYDVVLSTSSRLNLALHRLLRTILDRAEKTLDVGCLLPAGAEQMLLVVLVQAVRWASRAIYRLWRHRNQGL